MQMSEQLYNVWFVPTEKYWAWAHQRVKLKAENLSKDDAMEYVYFEHMDEPSPDRSEYWNYVAVPVGEIPKIGRRR